ncbi:tryptophanyl-tRNA synthetase [Williamsoniiplasma luminosum]|uniref:Tryptophan--tRNA ligase n=1 Tax=Williamsoniiplasma luminosum TaxID=214888 RepID=A0A2K8NUL6_9MOLU|nr:tryptophan--tRNA ligase [Williamsoniiplasma luminosum]ATZ17499.1 tryptophanyl-tRNA synthetase [Williamsoniiplasma luminosum]
MKEKMITGITPSGEMTLGNYLGAIKRAVEFQDEYELYVFIANLHAITIPQDKEILRKNTKEIAALYFACGLDPQKSTVFLQSDVLEHAQLGWILNTQSSIGELSRMTQFKDKSSKTKAQSKDYIPAGLFTYPTLMAADILMYDAKFVPVGIDQKQHVELTRDLAIRVNNKYGTVFQIPEPLISKDKIKIMDLQDPTKKMSKSSTNQKAIIYMLDEPKVIEAKIKAAITDSENLIKYDPKNKPGVANLMTIYTTLKKITIKEAEKHWQGKNYKDLKDDVAAALIETLAPIQQRYKQLYNSSEVEQWLKDAAIKAQYEARKKLNKVQNALGLNYNRK